MSNQQNDPKRNLKPGLMPQNAYSASPSQLTLPSDMSSAAMQNAYHYPYVPHHDPNAGFAFPPPNYRPQPQQMQPRGLPPPPHLGSQPQQPPQMQSQHQQQVQSPTNSRKRRASELGGGEHHLSSLPGSSSSNASAFTNPSGLMTGAGDIDVGLGGSGVPPSGAQQQGQGQTPIVKKGRTNTPWSPAEEQRLKMMRDQGSSWSEIAKQFPNRTEGSVKKHWYKDMHYADFGEDEVSSFSTALLQAIKEYETNKWKVIGQKVGKPAKACEQFAKEQGWKV